MSVHPSRLQNIPSHYSAPPTSSAPPPPGSDREADLKERVKNAILKSHQAVEGESMYPRREGRADGDRERGVERSSYRDRSRSRERESRRGREGDDRRDNRRSRSREYQPRDRSDRRPSPTYAAYSRRSPSPRGNREDGGAREGPPGVNGGGWQRAPPPHRGGPGAGFGQGGASGGFIVQGPSFLADRRKQRDENPLSIWPPSPKGPASNARDKPPKSKRSKKSSKKRRASLSDSDTDSDDSSRRHRRRKDKSRSSKHKSSSSRRKSSSKRSKRADTLSDSDSDSTDSDSEDDRRRSSKRRSSKSRMHKSDSEDEEEDEKKGQGEEDRVRLEMGDAFVPPSKPEEEEDEDIVGPILPSSKDVNVNSRDFGGHLRPGEGSAMAAFVSDGQRIPRRGEIGLESTAIEKYEASGYVMSGSRHTRMNAVRMRKENQVISAEEKRGILKMQAEEKAKRESMIVANFREMVSERLEQGGNRR